MAPITDRANTVWCPTEISASTSWEAWAFSPRRSVMVCWVFRPVAASTTARNGKKHTRNSPANIRALFMKSTALSRDQNVPTEPVLTRSAVAAPLSRQVRAFGGCEAPAAGVAASGGGDGPPRACATAALSSGCPS